MKRARISKVCVRCGTTFEVWPSADYRKYCTTECYFKATPEERFWAMVTKREDGHWEWTGYRNRTGYGLFRLNSKQNSVLAHRYAYELKNGPITGGLNVLHKRGVCVGNHWCVNWDHLYLGTPAQNAADRLADGRDVHQKGTRSPNAKLKAIDVIWIRKWFDNGHSLQSLCVVYNVSYLTIFNAATRRSYKDVK